MIIYKCNMLDSDGFDINLSYEINLMLTIKRKHHVPLYKINKFNILLYISFVCYN